MASPAGVVKLNPARLRVYLNRLPFCTRIIVFLQIALFVTGFIFSWLPDALSLIPSKVSIFSAHRLNTYPVVHAGFLHFLLDLLALTPLLSRFESDNGTLVTLALLAGPFATFPGVAYIIIEYFVLNTDHTVRGGSVWIFLLLCYEAVKTYRANPAFKIGPYNIPTYLYPLPVLIITHFTLPASLTTDSILLNVCACAVGYGFELGYLKFLVPPERAVRFVESKLNLLGRLPHYVSVDQKTYGRYGVLPTTASGTSLGVPQAVNARGISPARFAAANSGPRSPGLGPRQP